MNIYGEREITKRLLQTEVTKAKLNTIAIVLASNDGGYDGVRARQQVWWKIDCNRVFCRERGEEGRKIEWWICEMIVSW